MTRSGTACRLRPSVPLTAVTGSSWLPTPTKTRSGYNQSPSDGAAKRPSLETMAREGLWPTPMGSERETRPKVYPRGNPNLAAAVQRFPTPTVSEAERGHGYQMSNGKAYPTLTGAVGAAPGPDGKYFPTPAAQDGHNSSLPPSQAGRDTIPGRLVEERGSDGVLNPEWVEWLMGFPIGWTDVEPSETP